MVLYQGKYPIRMSVAYRIKIFPKTILGTLNLMWVNEFPIHVLRDYTVWIWLSIILRIFMPGVDYFIPFWINDTLTIQIVYYQFEVNRKFFKGLYSLLNLVRWSRTDLSMDSTTVVGMVTMVVREHLQSKCLKFTDKLNDFFSLDRHLQKKIELLWKNLDWTKLGDMSSTMIYLTHKSGILHHS